MASKEYKDNLRKEDPDKYHRIYGTKAKRRYLDNMKINNPLVYKDKIKSIKLSYKQNNPESFKYGKVADKLKGQRSIVLSLLRSNNGYCDICKKELNKKYVDHCHSSGKVRGILCFSCNIALGHANDDIEVLKSMISYLRRFEGDLSADMSLSEHLPSSRLK